MPKISCIWCGKSAPLVEPSREHLLPDYMGVRAMLPSGVVCKPCNNNLNTLVDMPLKAVLQPLLTHFNVASSKRDSLAKSQVTVFTSLGTMPGVMMPGGRVEIPSMRLDHVSDGKDALETWIATEDEMPPLLERMKTRAESVDVIQTEKLEISGHVGRLHGKGRSLITAAVKATLNYLAFTGLENAYRPSLASAKNYVIGGTKEARTQVAASASKSLVTADPSLRVSDFRLEHSIIVEATPGKDLSGELRVFGDAFIHVVLTTAWDGPALSLRQFFTPEQRT